MPDGNQNPDDPLQPVVSRGQEVTGPSSEPVAPVVQLGTVSAPVVRSGGQVLTAGVLVQGLEVFNVGHLSTAQTGWLIIVLTPIVTLVMNLLEAKYGRRLVGAPQ